MQHHLETVGDGLRITARVDPARQEALLAEFQQCASGHCQCPTPQYAKLQSVDVSAEAGVVSITLSPKPGEQIDQADIERCLDHTARQAGA